MIGPVLMFLSKMWIVQKVSRTLHHVRVRKNVRKENVFGYGKFTRIECHQCKRNLILKHGCSIYRHGWWHKMFIEFWHMIQEPISGLLRFEESYVSAYRSSSESWVSQRRDGGLIYIVVDISKFIVKRLWVMNSNVYNTYAPQILDSSLALRFLFRDPVRILKIVMTKVFQPWRIHWWFWWWCVWWWDDLKNYKN